MPDRQTTAHIHLSSHLSGAVHEFATGGAALFLGFSFQYDIMKNGATRKILHPYLKKTKTEPLCAKMSPNDSTFYFLQQHSYAEVCLTVKRFWVRIRSTSFCVEFIYSPRACLGFLRLLRFPPTPKHAVGLIGNSKLSAIVNGCLSLCPTENCHFSAKPSIYWIPVPCFFLLACLSLAL